LINLFRG